MFMVSLQGNTDTRNLEIHGIIMCMCFQKLYRKMKYVVANYVVAIWLAKHLGLLYLGLSPLPIILVATVTGRVDNPIYIYLYIYIY